MLFPEYQIAVPYELIGKFVFNLLVLCLIVFLLLMTFATLYAIWYRGLTYIINKMWEGYTIRGEHPPPWRRKISMIAVALRDGNREDIAQIRDKLDKLEENYD